MIEWLVSPVLHWTVPVTPVAVNTELPQLFTTFIPGVSTIKVTGAAFVLAAAPVQPSTVCDTVYVPSFVTVMELVVSPVLHNNDPLIPVAVNNELPQLLTTDTSGAEGMGLGVAV